MSLERSAFGCSHRLALESETRTQQQSAINDSRSGAALWSSTCPLPFDDRLGGRPAPRTGYDDPRDTLRPGGAQRQNSLGLRVAGPLPHRWRADLTLRYTQVDDLEGYSPLLENNLKRITRPLQFGIELPAQPTKHCCTALTTCCSCRASGRRAICHCSRTRRWPPSVACAGVGDHRLLQWHNVCRGPREETRATWLGPPLTFAVQSRSGTHAACYDPILMFCIFQPVPSPVVGRQQTPNPCDAHHMTGWTSSAHSGPTMHTARPARLQVRPSGPALDSCR